jgi:hypothetical protein
MESARTKEVMKGVETEPEHSFVNNFPVYDSPDSVMKCIERNEAEPKLPDLSTGQISSTCKAMKDKKELENIYQTPKHSIIQTVEYENPAFTSCEENE